MTTASEPILGHETRKSFHESLDELKTDVIRLGALVTEAIGAGTQALLDSDLAAAEKVVHDDDAIDRLEHAVEEKCFLLLATQQPTAGDLRRIVTVLRVAHELERSGDLMVDVAKSARRLYPHALDPKTRGILDQMGAQATVETRVAIDAFADDDAEVAAALVDMDDVMDELTKSLFRQMLSWNLDHQESSLQKGIQIALVGRHYERIADHAVTIALRVQYMITGTHWREGRDSPISHD